MEESNVSKGKRAKTQTDSIRQGINNGDDRRRNQRKENVRLCRETDNSGVQEKGQKEGQSTSVAARPRPKTSGGIVRQLILQTENQLAQKKSDIEFLESQLEQFREMLSEWQAGVSAIEPSQDIK